MDEFEKHIVNHRDQFDDFSVDESKLWKSISNELDQNTNPVLKLFSSYRFKIAASVLLIFGLTSVVTFISTSSNNVANEHVLGSEFREIDNHYKGMVSYHIQLLEKNEGLSEAYKKEFLSFMDELDDEYELLKKEMVKDLNNERVLEAIIYNYKKRIELIENLLNRINTSQKISDDESYIL